MSLTDKKGVDGSLKVAVVPNLSKPQAVSCAQEIVLILSSHGCDTLVLEELFTKDNTDLQKDRDTLSSCNIIIAVGGDGTIIHTAKLAASVNRPLLGVNAGTLGFTAGVERDGLYLLPNLLTNDYREEKRLMLNIELFSHGEKASYLALNDAVVSGETASIIDYKMALGENSGYVYRADGFIVATPTGSTAYSLSAGGPVIQPDMDCLVYTPVCAHALFGRSVIFGGDTRLTVKIPENKGRLYLTVDGETPIKLSLGDKLVFSRSQRFARFLRLGRKDFYDVLNQKILSNGR